MQRFILGFALSFAAANLVSGQDKQLTPIVKPVLIDDIVPAKVAMHPLTPYLESTSAIVVDIDVTKLDVKKTAQWLQTHFEPARQNPLPKDQIAMAAGFVESLTAAGVSHLYVTASTQLIIDGGPVIVIPCDNTAKVSDLGATVVKAMPPQGSYIVHAGEDTVLIGPKVAVERLIAAEGTTRADLVLPLTANSRSDHMAIASLPDAARKELAAMWPERIPNAPELDISPRDLAKQINSINIHWNLPPNAKASARIFCPTVVAPKVEAAVKDLIAMSPDAKQVFETTTATVPVTVTAAPENLAKMLAAMAGPARRQANHQASVSALKQIGVAMLNYHAVHKHFPPRVLTDPKGKPLLGWRVTILPYLEQLALYDAIKMDQAWDSDANKPFGDTVIAVYRTGNEASKNQAFTRIRVPVMEGSFWHGEGPPRSLRDITDGTSNTIAAIIAPPDAETPWMSPESWLISVDDPMKDVFSDMDLIVALYFDGSIHTFTKDEMNNERLKALLTFAGGEVID